MRRLNQARSLADSKLQSRRLATKHSLRQEFQGLSAVQACRYLRLRMNLNDIPILLARLKDILVPARPELRQGRE